MMNSYFGAGRWGQRQQLKRALVAALEHAPLTGARPMLLSYFPVVSQNPFQSLLYRSAREHGAVVMPMPRLSLPEINFDDAQPVLHLHWIHKLLASEDAGLRTSQTLKALERRFTALRQDGVKLLWTVHNSMSHGGKDPSAEKALRQLVADQADAIHIMNPATVALCKPFFDIDTDKCFTAPHPAVGDAYPNYIDKASARLSFDMLPGQPLFLLFGRLQRQKGIARMVDAFIEAQARHFAGEARLIIAGSVVEPEFLESIAEAVNRPDIRLVDQRIPDGDLQRFFVAADVVTCPYESSLNSGVAITALSFGRHLLAPRPLSAVFGDSAAVSYVDQPDVTHLADSLFTAYERARLPETATAAADWAAAHASTAMSDLFFQQVRSRLV